MFKEMKHFWENQDKVSSLQIAIQVTPMKNYKIYSFEL